MYCPKRGRRTHAPVLRTSIDESSINSMQDKRAREPRTRVEELTNDDRTFYGTEADESIPEINLYRLGGHGHGSGKRQLDAR